MKKLIKHIAQSLVDYPNQVDVKEIRTHQTHILELRVSKKDLGKVIGRKCRTANAMRTFLACVSAKRQKRILLEIIE